MTRVNFSFRVVRKDRQPMHKRELFAVLQFFLGHRRAPDGYKILAVNWTSAKGRTKAARSESEATDTMIDHFWNILKVKGLDALRAGSVKRNRL